ncbi:hypothetical protein P8C59_006940 [Phyllachora maydis]|uniref:Uncharacterized protein n=1 Tax=Phyllachora maydis TaxID=1825666 RepID=A0AAD9I8I6_9PEZI|nr:hypothetical protein P8C59_006940 [Phyllachora maydis]
MGANKKSSAGKSKTSAVAKTTSKVAKTKTAENMEKKHTDHVPTTGKSQNGRVKGRSLIPWGRPRMAEKLLLHLQYECARHKVNVPWDAVAHRLHPGSSGGAVLQHLTKLRPVLIAEGHVVPPVPQKPSSRGARVDESVRGYVRVEGAADQTATRPVYFGADADADAGHRRFNRPDAAAFDERSLSARAVKEQMLATSALMGEEEDEGKGVGEEGADEDEGEVTPAMTYRERYGVEDEEDEEDEENEEDEEDEEDEEENAAEWYNDGEYSEAYEEDDDQY